MIMIFYDFEVFAHDWLVVCIDMTARAETVIVNDPGRLKIFHEEHNNDIWVGFNSREYDSYILKAILLGFDPKEVNDWIIVQHRRGWEYSSLFRKIRHYDYDVVQSLDRGLKFFEGSMGADIRETSVPFDIDRKLTSAEIAETIRYCRHDVEQTVEVFLRRKADFDAQMGLIKMFSLPLADISRTKAQLSAKILEASRRSYADEFDIDLPPTMRIERYREVPAWFADPANHKYTLDPDNPASHKMKLDVTIAGVPHTFAWGGVHGAIPRYFADGYFINMDVASLYPSLMIRYSLHSRSCNPAKFNEIVETRLKYKREHNPMQAPLKIVINGTYGAMKDKHNPLYDPRQANRVCVYGQLLILDLIERLEEADARIIQSNTDGVLVRMPDEYHGRPDAFYARMDDVAHEWETRTGLTLEFDEYNRVVQGDVNNYIIVAPDGHWKSKGAHLKKLGDLDYDLPIVNHALVAYLVDGTPPERTIMACDDLREFQQIVRASGKYRELRHGGRSLGERTARVFASLDPADGGMSKIHAVTGRAAKCANTPERCFIINEDVRGQHVPGKLDRQWYIDLVRQRARKFGG